MMKKKIDQSELLHEIRIGYQGLVKSQKGEQLTATEKRALDNLAPVDVTYVLLSEIDKLNQHIIALIEENAHLRDHLTDKNGPLDIDKP